MDSLSSEKPVADLLDLRSKWEMLVDKAATNGYAALTPVEKIWLNAQYLMNSIGNGGLAGYYRDSTTDTLDDCMKALQVLGATKMRAALECMNTFFPDGVPKDIIARNEVIDSWPVGDEVFDGILDELGKIALSVMEELEAKIVEFIRKTGL